MTTAIEQHIDLLRVDMVVRDLERREFFNRHPYAIKPSDTFTLCEECDGVQGLAVLEWSWPIAGSYSNGSAVTCANVHCVRTAIEQARDDSAAPEDVECSYPCGVELSPAITWIAAA